MTREDYLQYYIQGSEHYLIPKDIFDELFNEMNNWKREAQKQKEVIDRAIEYISELDDNTDDTTCYDIDKDKKERLLQILDIDKGE